MNMELLGDREQYQSSEDSVGGRRQDKYLPIRAQITQKMKGGIP